MERLPILTGWQDYNYKNIKSTKSNLIQSPSKFQPNYSQKLERTILNFIWNCRMLNTVKVIRNNNNNKDCWREYNPKLDLNCRARATKPAWSWSHDRTKEASGVRSQTSGQESLWPNSQHSLWHSLLPQSNSSHISSMSLVFLQLLGCTNKSFWKWSFLTKHNCSCPILSDKIPLTPSPGPNFNTYHYDPACEL